MHSAQKKPIPEIDSEVEIKEVMEMIKYIMIDGDFIPRVRANGCFLATLKMYLWTGNSILPQYDHRFKASGHFFFIWCKI